MNYMNSRDGVYHLESNVTRALPSQPAQYYLEDQNNQVFQKMYQQQSSQPQSSNMSSFQQKYEQQMRRGTSAVQSQQKPSKAATTRVKVVVRVRPPIPEDSKQNYGEYADCTEIVEDDNKILLSRQAYEDRKFSFDKVLSQKANQDEMFSVVAKPIVDDVLLGYNGTILAYGQTGTGKTFTIFGPGNWEPDPRRRVTEKPIVFNEDGEWVPDKQSGVIPRTVQQIFEHIRNNDQNTEFRVTVSFCQIYMETIMDLLDASKVNLSIREDPKLGIFVDNLTQIQVNEPQEIIQLIKEGAQNRAVSPTNMNKVSSRSHVILNITIEQKPYDEKKGEAAVKRGTLIIVDLAGSERVSKSGSEGQRLEEAKKINKSLSALGNCVAALIDDNITHVPFRDSKLTRLLSDSLGGNSKTCLVATIGPAVWNYDETFSTLTFATRAMAVKNHAVINEVVDFKTLSGNLQRKISLIESEKYRLIARNVDLEREVAALRNKLESASTQAHQFQAAQLHQLQMANALHKQQQTPPSQSPERRNGSTWEEREKQLVDKFTSIINSIRMDKARQSIMYFTQSQSDGDLIVEQLITGFLSIPSLRTRILAKLIPDFRRLSPNDLDELESQYAMQQLQIQQLVDHLQRQQQQVIQQQQQQSFHDDQLREDTETVDELASFFDNSHLSNTSMNSYH